jgi:hypothetical protein
MCEPEVSVIAFDSVEFNVLNVADEMTSRGWHLNALQNPSGIHIAVTKMHTLPGVATRFVNDLRESVKVVMSRDDKLMGKTVRISKNFHNALRHKHKHDFIFSI